MKGTKINILDEAGFLANVLEEKKILSSLSAVQTHPAAKTLTCAIFCILISNNWNNRGSEHTRGLSDEVIRNKKILYKKKRQRILYLKFTTLRQFVA